MASSCTRLTSLPLAPPLLSKIFSSPRLHHPQSTRQFRSLLLSSSASFYFPTCAAASIPTLTLEGRTVPVAAGFPVIARNVIEVLEERELIESVTHEDIRSFCARPTSAPVKVYCGFDPTAESLHLGNLLGLIVLSWFQRCGHVPVALLGGATARVGDPSGKSIERPSLDEATIEKNLKGVRSNIEQVLRVKVRANDALGSITTDEISRARVSDAAENVKTDGISRVRVGNGAENIKTDETPRGGHASEDTNTGVNAAEASDIDEEGSLPLRTHRALVMNNYDWWKDFSLLHFLRDVGKYARVGTMMAKESVKTRLNSEEGMSFTEFTYQLLQGYDFVHLFRNEGVSIQIGGSDQWGNITAGTDLIRKILQQEGAFGLTFPLLLKSDGTKFGKSESGAIWLAASMLSPYKFYQYLFATPDADVIKFLKRLTFLSLEEIRELEATMGKPDYIPNNAQRKLAEEVTRFVHGEEGLEEARTATEALAPGGTTRLDWKSIEAIASDLPSFSTSQSSVLGSAVVDVCVTAGLLASKTAVRRLIKQGGLYLNNEKVEDEGKIVQADDIVDNRMLLLSAGKKNKMVVRLQ